MNEEERTESEVFILTPTAHEEARGKALPTKREVTKRLKALERSLATKALLWDHWTIPTRCRELATLLNEYKILGESPPLNVLLVYAAIVAGREDVQPAIVPKKESNVNHCNRERSNGRSIFSTD